MEWVSMGSQSGVLWRQTRSFDGVNAICMDNLVNGVA